MTSLTLALTDRDFDAYLPDKAGSNAFTRPRLEVKQRALAWARNVTARIGDLGSAVEVHATDEHPSHRNKRRVDSQWVFFWRDEAARNELEQLLDRARSIADVIDDPSPYTRHAFLGLRVDGSAVEVCFAVHPEAKVDIDNLRARLAEGAEHLAEELAKALHALPDQFEIRAGSDQGETTRLPSGTASPAQIADVLARAVSENVPLWIGWRVPRQTAIEHSEILDEQLEDAVLALFPVYRLIAWSRDNDHVGIDREIADMHQEQARAHAEVVALDEKWKAEQEKARQAAAEAARARAAEAGTGRRSVTLATLFKNLPPKEGTAPADKTTAPEERDGSGKGAALASGTRGGPQASPRGSSGKAKHGSNESSSRKQPMFATRSHGDHGAKRDGSSEPTWEKGAKVGILTGPFAGKVGTIAEMEGSRSARVLLGLLSTRIEIAQLTLLDASGAAFTKKSAQAEDGDTHKATG